MFDARSAGEYESFEAWEGEAVDLHAEEDLDVRQYYGPDGFIHRPTINGMETACGQFSTTHLVWRKASYEGEPCRDCYSIFEVAKFIEFNVRNDADAERPDGGYIGLATGPTRTPMPRMTNPDGDDERNKK